MDGKIAFEEHWALDETPNTHLGVAHSDTKASSANIGRRALLAIGAAAGSLTLKGPFATAAPAARMRIDAHSHFAPTKFLDFAEKAEGRPFPLTPLYKSKRTLTEVGPRLDLVDQYEIDLSVLVPVPWIEGFHKLYANPKLAAEAARLMNDELADVIAAHPTRFRGVAILPVVDPEAMVAELRRAIVQLGFVGAYVAIGPIAKRMDHADYEHLYRTLVELDATLWLHPSRPPLVTDHPDEKLSRYYEWQLIGWPYDTTTAMFQIVFSGVFDRYPSVRVVTHHHGALVPLLESRLINGWPTLEPIGLPMPAISKPYIDHFRKFYCDTAASGYAPKVLELSADFFGSGRVLFGSDAPFDVADGHIFIPETVRSIEAMNVSQETRTAIFSKNAARILKIN